MKHSQKQLGCLIFGLYKVTYINAYVYDYKHFSPGRTFADKIDNEKYSINMKVTLFSLWKNT